MSLGTLDWGGSYVGRRTGMRRRGFVVDMPLLITLLLVSALGLTVLYSAAGGNPAPVLRQGIRLAIGFGVCLLIAQLPPRYLRMWTPWLFFAVLGLLLLVATIGVTEKGAQRWLDLQLFRFQPSELMKIVTPMMIAWYMHERCLPPSFLQLIAMALIVAAPALLIARQPDLGTALLVTAAGGLTVLLAGINLRVITGLFVIGLVSVPVLWSRMFEYQRARVITFLNPESDPLGAGYNIIQSKIAIGSGGLFGKGWLNGTQAHLEFLP